MEITKDIPVACCLFIALPNFVSRPSNVLAFDVLSLYLLETLELLLGLEPE